MGTQHSKAEIPLAPEQVKAREAIQQLTSNTHATTKIKLPQARQKLPSQRSAWDSTDATRLAKQANLRRRRRSNLERDMRAKGVRGRFKKRPVVRRKRPGMFVTWSPGENAYSPSEE